MGCRICGKGRKKEDFWVFGLYEWMKGGDRGNLKRIMIGRSYEIILRLRFIGFI